MTMQPATHMNQGLLEMETRDLPPNDRQHGSRTGFPSQLNALLRKNLSYQKRRLWSNACIIVLPIFFVILLTVIQILFNLALDSNPDTKCGCACLECCHEGKCRTGADGGPITCQHPEKCTNDVCGPKYSNSEQIAFCSIDNPSSWPPVLAIPEPGERARQWAPGVVLMISGLLPSAKAILDFFFPIFDEGKAFEILSNPPDFGNPASNESFHGEGLSAAGLYLGSPADPSPTGYVETAYVSAHLSALTQDCSGFPQALVDQYSSAAKQSVGDRLGFALDDDSFRNEKEYLQCVNSPVVEFSEANISRRLFCSYKEARCDGKISVEEQAKMKTLKTHSEKQQEVEKYPNAWDFSGTNESSLSLNIWYDAREEDGGPPELKRLNLALNMASSSWMKWVLGDDFSSQLLALQEVPKQTSKLRLEISSLLALLFFTWITQLLLPMMLVQMVYERENGLRIMMKMHGLSDQAYWTISYIYYYVLYIIYIAIFLLMSTVARLAVITDNDYGVTCVFFFLYGHVQIGLAAILSNLFKSSSTATSFGFLWVLKCGLVGQFLVNLLIRRNRWYVYLIELIPGYSCYRAIYELAQYGFTAAFSGGVGLTWSKFGDENNHMQYILIVLLVEWPLFLLTAWYLEQVVDNGIGVQRHPLFFLDWLAKGPGKLSTKTLEEEVYTRNTSSTSIQIDTESDDVKNERAMVRNMQPADLQNCGIVVDGLHKQFPADEGSRPKVAVHDLTFAVKKGEVFGLLGPNGAGKTTSINMLIGFMPPTSGHAQVSSYDIRTDMEQIYSLMGVCPQHNLLWDVVTGYEHLLFYGRMKGLKGDDVIQATVSALHSVNLFQSAHKQVRTYSGGMKRRLSVAISLIGTPDVVFLDEPSTGLDPASRKNLWKVVAAEKPGKSIILTTHSMEEAEVLCDRLGIFVAGRLVALGNPKQLIAQYGGYRVFTLMTKNEMVKDATLIVTQRFPNATLSYSVGGTLKFDLPANTVAHSDVFAFVEKIKEKSLFEIEDWGVTDVTLEDVFIKIARDAGAKSDDASLAVD